ncbi:MAG: DUF732 domain-containing protein [Mycobacterium sp.]
MKLLMALIGASVVIGAAVPAHAEPSASEEAGAEEASAVSNAGFLDSLHAAGITFNNPDQAVAAGRAVCGLVNKGESPLQVIVDLKTYNPGFSADSAHAFAAIAAQSYCSPQLVKK